MRLNQAGKDQLKADLRANAKRYTQNRFGVITKDCGTECCMAGMCLMRKIGAVAFEVEVRKGPMAESFINACLAAGAEQLGITMLDDDEYEEITREDEDGTTLAPIFAQVKYWPEDLRADYEEAEEKHDHVGMAEVACRALDQIDENGVFV